MKTKVKILIISSTGEQKEEEFLLPSTIKEYEIADLAFERSLLYLQKHPSLSLEDIDYSWTTEE